MLEKNLFATIIAILTCINLFANQPIDVVENTIKVPALSEEVFYYGFATGDQVIFNFEEVNGKELKELEIIEMPASSKFMDYKTKKIENKILNILNGGIYKFRFANSSIAGRICKFKIQRIPTSDASVKFNTGVYTKEVFDTTYSTEQEPYVEKSDTLITNLISQVAKVHSQGNLNGNKTTFNFALPKNTIAWSYYIGVDQAGQNAYEQASKKIAENSSYFTNVPGYGPLAALALGTTPYLSQLQSGEDIDFYMVQNENVNLFLTGQAFRYFKKGKVINDFARMDPVPGMLHVCFSNDNALMGVNVIVKISSVQVRHTIKLRAVQKIKVSSRQEMYLKS